MAWSTPANTRSSPSRWTSSCLTVRDGEFQVLLVERGGRAVRGRLALPAGSSTSTRTSRTLPAASFSRRPSIAAPPFLDQLETYGHPDRDPRGRTVSVAYLAVGARHGRGPGRLGCGGADWHPVADFLRPRRPRPLAFDHHTILRDAVGEPGPSGVLTDRDDLLPAGVHHRRTAPACTRRCGGPRSTPPTSTARSPKPTVSSSRRGSTREGGRRASRAALPTREGQRIHPPLNLRVREPAQPVRQGRRTRAT